MVNQPAHRPLPNGLSFFHTVVERPFATKKTNGFTECAFRHTGRSDAIRECPLKRQLSQSQLAAITAGKRRFLCSEIASGWWCGEW